MAPSRIPPLLQPFVRTKHDSLQLLTSTLDASANWILTRFLCDALGPGSDGPNNVVLVSWMRDYEFWRHEVRKGTGLDLGSLRTEGRFAFVDGLSALFLPAEDDDEAEKRPQSLPATRALQPQATRGPLPGRTLPATAQAPPRVSPSSPGLYTLSAPSLDHVHATITAALASLRSSAAATSTLVILDNPDILLASVPALAPSNLTSLFLTLHTQKFVSHVLVHLQSDLALLTPSSPPQPLQIAHQNLVVKTAHMSAKVLGVRVLDTGVARDVSGVLRATVNKDSWASIGTRNDVDDGVRGDVERPEEMGLEVLYKVHGDGSVRVFERGTATV